MYNSSLHLTLFLLLTSIRVSGQAVELMVLDRPTTHNIELVGQDEVEVRLKGLLPGETFDLYLQQDPTYPAVVYTHVPEIVDEFGTIWMTGKSDGKPLVFCLDVLAKNLKAIDLLVIKNQKENASGLNKVNESVIEVEANKDLDFMLNNLFRKDTCFALFPGSIRSNPRNINLNRPTSQTGIFRNGFPTVGIDSGIIISTGFIESAPGPNNFANSQQGFIDFDPMNEFYPEFESLLPPGELMHDVVVLEFDFIPTTDTISFNYVFFSEEYCQINTLDAFGFLLSGPLGNDVNIARLPVSGDIVSPSTLNPSSPDSAFFRHNTTSDFDHPCYDFPPPPERFAGIAYDGFSVPLTATGRVVPCARHTLKMVVLDGEDFLSDSGVMLEAGSFLAGLVNKPEPNTTAEVSGLTPVEGCDSATITFSRRTLTPAALSEPLFVKYNVIPFSVTGSIGAATRGVTGASADSADYILPESPFVIPVGDTTGTLSIPILLDADENEGIEAFIVRYDGTCDCTENADTFYIRDNAAFTVELGPDRTACAGEPLVITAMDDGSSGNLTYLWPDPTIGDTNMITYISTGRDTTIVLTVMNDCGLTSTDSVTISAPNITADVDGFYSLCSDPIAMVNLVVGGTPSAFYDIVVRVDSNGVVTDTPLRILGDTIFEFTRSADFSVLSVTNDGGCSGSGGNNIARIRSAFPTDTSRVIQPSCDQANGSIDVLLLDGNANFDFRWLDGSGSVASSRTGLVAGMYAVEITPTFDMNCPDTLQFDLLGTPLLRINEIRTFIDGVQRTPSCPGETVQLAPIVSGGTPPYVFSWPDSMSTDSILTVTSSFGRTVYPVSVTDACGEIAEFDAITELSDFSVELGGRYSLCDANRVAVPIITRGAPGTYTVEIRIDSAGFSTTRFLLRSPGSSSLFFNYAATITAVGITNAGMCVGDTISGVATVVDPQLRFNADVTDVRCNGESTGSISLTDAGNVPVIFVWGDIGPGSAVRTGLPAATYDLRIQDSADVSCFRDTSIVLVEPSVLAVTLDAGTALCTNENDTLAPRVTGGTLPYQFSWPDSLRSDSLLAIVTRPGMTEYRVVVTDGCGDSQTATILYDLPDVSASISGTFNVCNSPTASVPLLLSGSSAYTVLIRENGIERVLNLTAGTDLVYSEATTIKLVSVAGADMCAGVIVLDSATVLDDNYLVVGNEANVTCLNGADGSLDLVVNDDSEAYTYVWDTPGLSGPNPTGLVAGTYAVTITDTLPSACSFDTTFIISEPTMLLLDAATSPVMCPGETIELIPIVSGGTAPYVYDWDNGTSIDSAYVITTEVGTTRYPLVVTDFCGLSVRDTITIILNNLRAEVSGTYSVCNSPNVAQVPVTFTGSGPYTFVVNENGTERTLFATGDTMLNYTEATEVQLISVTDGDNCPGVAGGIANVTDAVFNVAVQLQNVQCKNDDNGSISVSVNGNNIAYTFGWDRPGLSGPDITGLRGGVYNLTVTDLTSFACTWDTTFTVLEPASEILLSRDSARDETCNSLAFGSAVYTGGTGQLNYEWNNGTNGNILGEVPAGLYTLSVTDDNDCEVTQVFNLQDRRTEIQASIQASDIALSCDVAQLTLSAAQLNTQVITYSWRDQADNEIGTARGTEITSPGRYFVTLTNQANGCSATDSIDIVSEDDSPLVLIPDEFAITCNDDTVDLTAEVPDSIGRFAYEWRLNGVLLDSSAILSNVSILGTYELTVTREDNGCFTVVTTEVVIDREDPDVRLDAPVVTSNCRNPEVSIGVAAAGPYAYEWSTTDGNITGSSAANRTTADQPGLYTVILTDTLNGCTSMASVTVTNEGVTLTPDAGPDQTLICSGGGTVLAGRLSSAPTGFKVRWFAPDGSTIGNNLQVSTLDFGPHVLEAVHPTSGCSSFDTVMVISEAPSAVTYSLQQPPCPEVGGRLFVNEVTGLNGPFSYSSPTGSPEPFGTGLRELRIGTNVLIVTDQLGCELRDTFEIFPGETLEGEAEDVVIRTGDEAVLGITTNRNDGQIASWRWRNLSDSLACLNCPDPRVSPLESFVAEVTVMDSNGCVLILQQNVIVEEEDLIYMPSGFSPNGDGVNDIFTVFGDRELVNGVNFFRVFDRWGNLVFTRENFQVNDPLSGWTGEGPDGQISQSGVYIYSVSYNRWDGEAEVVQGDVTLVE